MTPVAAPPHRCDHGGSVRHSVAQTSAALRADAASIFLLSRDRLRLHGAIVGWDWTRTSFVAQIEQWPSVARAIAENAAFYLTAENARRAEEAWFERRGIHASICAPMAVHGRVIGIVFFDFTTAEATTIDLTLAKRIADQCAAWVERAPELLVCCEGGAATACGARRPLPS